METRRNPFSSLSVIFVVCVVLVFSTCKFFGGGDDDVSVTGVSLNISSTSLNIGGTETLIATVSPDDATNQNVTWSTSDPAVATVSSEGIVTAVAAGTAAISVTTEDGGFVDGCDVLVEEAGAPVVYVAGYYFDGNDVACYWVNDSVGKVVLHDATAARANSLYVFNDNVYVGGYYTNGSAKNAAVYWENNSSTIVELYNSTTHGRINGIFVTSGGDVLATGFYNNGTDDIASYWRNSSSNKTELFSGDDSNSYSIYESSGNVYVSGFYNNGLYDLASYWINDSGSKVDLTSTNFAKAYSVFYQGGIVYAAGEYLAPPYYASYWVDVSTARTDLTAVSAKAYSVTVFDNDIYVAGYYYNGLNNVACYWINNAGVKVDLFNDSETSGNHAEAKSIYISGSDVYVSGFYTSGGFKIACYWKNGVKTDLTDGMSDAVANSIFVQ